MSKVKQFLITACVLSGCLVPVAAVGMQATAARDTKPSPLNKGAASAPSAQDIAAAKAKGLVWVNTSTHVYHKDGEFYGATKHGKFLTEDDARKAGYKAAQEEGQGGKKARAKSK